MTENDQALDKATALLERIGQEYNAQGFACRSFDGGRVLLIPAVPLCPSTIRVFAHIEDDTLMFSINAEIGVNAAANFAVCNLDDDTLSYHVRRRLQEVVTTVVERAAG